MKIIEKRISISMFVILMMLFLSSCASMMGLTEEVKQQLIENDLPIAIVRYSTETPNFVGGVDASIQWVNISSEDIKYIIFSVNPYNRVDDIVSSDIGNKTLANLKGTGPYKATKTSPQFLAWKNVWYNNTITRMEIVGLTIIFMDDTRVSYSASEVQDMIV